MPHSVLWSSPLITLEFCVLIILSVELRICPPCSIFNLNMFSNINKFSIFGYLCDIFLTRCEKIFGPIVPFFIKFTYNERCLVETNAKIVVLKLKTERNWIFDTNSDFLISIPFMELDDFVNISYLDYYRIHSLKYPRSTTLSRQCIGIRKSEFVTKTQFLCQKK